MSKPDEVHVKWTARLIDPLKESALGDGSGLTPDAALQSLIRDLRWKEERERASAGRLTTALEVALRESSVLLSSNPREAAELES